MIPRRLLEFAAGALVVSTFLNCSSDDAPENAEPKAATSEPKGELADAGPSLRLTRPSERSMATHACSPISVSVDQGEPPATITLIASGSAQAYGSVEQCRTGTPATSIVTSGHSTTFYCRNDVAEVSTLTANAIGFAPAKLTIRFVPFDVLGQPDGDAMVSLRLGLHGAGDVFSTPDDKLLVADTGNNRVLVYDSFPASPTTPASLVLGQADLVHNLANDGGVTGATLDHPNSVWSDGTRLVVSDTGNHRVLVWNEFPKANGQAADFAIGQPGGNLGTNAPNNEGRSGNSLDEPLGVHSDGTRLLIADSANRRVLVWSTFPTAAGQNADLVIGQPDLQSEIPDRPTSELLGAPTAITILGGKLFVADSSPRVLVWNVFPTTNRARADFVLGQPSFFRATPNRGGISAASLGSADDVHTDGTRLFVADATNHRVLVWNTTPTTTHQPADAVLGQPDFLTGDAMTPGFAAKAVSTNGSRVVLADANRVLVWNAFPTSATAAASFALGQPDGPANLDTNDINHAAPTAATADFSDIAICGERLYAVDRRHHRVLVWTTLPTSPLDLASFALGQPPGPDNLTSALTGPPTPSSLSMPSSVACTATRLFVSDTGNHRVLAWNALPSGPVPADFALGQSAGDRNLATNTRPTVPEASSLDTPTFVRTDGSRLYVVDSENYRIVVFNALPTSGGQAADAVLGQPNFRVKFGPIASASTFWNIGGIAVGSGHLAISDPLFHRALVWQTPVKTGAAALFALGQPPGPDNTTTTEERAASSSSLGEATGVTIDDRGRLFIADASAHRVLEWKTVPTAPEQLPTSVFGQPSFTTSNQPAMSASMFVFPSALASDGLRLFVADPRLQRVVVLPVP